MSKGQGSLVEGLIFCPLILNDHNNDDKIREDKNEGNENKNIIIIPTKEKVKLVKEEINYNNYKRSPRNLRGKTQGDLVKDLIVIDHQPKKVRNRNIKQISKKKATASRLNQEDTDNGDSSSSSIIYIDKDEDDDYSPSNSDNDGSSFSKGSIQSNNDESANMMDLDDDDDDDQIVTKSKIGFVNDDFLDSDDTEHTSTNRKKNKKSPIKQENDHANKTMDLSDSDDHIPKRRKLTRYSRNELNRVPQLASTTHKPTSSEYYSNSSEQSNNEESDHQNETDDQENEDKTLTPSRTSKYYPINCPSTEDEITLQPFRANKPHVCYLAPDGKTRHCYHLDTLYRAAIMAGLRRYDERGKMQLLQPPHFSQIMYDDIMDQIATRFGRQALNIEDSKVYKKIVVHGIQLSRRSYSFGNDNEDDEYNYVNFEQRINNYFQDLMSTHSDLYCCPLCYTTAHNRYQNKSAESESDSESDAEASLPDYSHDPMELLGDLDDKKYKIAATFCFRRLTQVKKHLRVKHNLVISNVDGSDLYQRFRIRATDGLLQRYLLHEKDNYRKELFENGTIMRSYWARGHSHTYLALIAHVDELGDRSDDGEIDPLVSISSRRKEISLWDQIHAPFAVENGEVMNDFITDENDEVEYFSGADDASKEEENETEQENPMEKMIAELKERRKKQRGSNHNSSSSSSSSDNSLDKSSTDENEFDSDEDNIKEKESGDDSSSEDELVLPSQVKRKKMTPKERILSQRREIMHSNSDDDELEILSPPNTQPETTDDFIELADSD